MSRHPRPQRLARRPTVTVVVPCYNYGRYLPAAVGSVLEQPGVDVELILIDDASPDGSAGVVRDLAARDGRIRPILHASNRGHIGTYNEGLADARGDYVVLMSADDALTPGALERATALLEAHPSVGFVYGHPMEFADEPPPVSQRVRSWTVWSGEDWIERRCRTGRNCILSPEVVMRTSVLREIGLYDPALPHSGDFELWLRAAAVSDVGRVDGPAQAYYRVHDQNMHLTQHLGHAIDLEGRRAAFEKALVGFDARVPRGQELFAMARRALAGAALECARSACDHGRAEIEPIDQYMDFAARAWPAIQRTRAWRALERRGERDARAVHRSPAAWSRRLQESIVLHLRWRRWHWTGT